MGFYKSPLDSSFTKTFQVWNILDPRFEMRKECTSERFPTRSALQRIKCRYCVETFPKGSLSHCSLYNDSPASNGGNWPTAQVFVQWQEPEHWASTWELPGGSSTWCLFCRCQPPTLHTQGLALLPREPCVPLSLLDPKLFLSSLGSPETLSCLCVPVCLCRECDEAFHTALLQTHPFPLPPMV